MVPVHDDCMCIVAPSLLPYEMKTKNRMLRCGSNSTVIFTPTPFHDFEWCVCRPRHCSPRCETFRSAVVDTGGPARNVQKALWLAVSASLGLLVVGNVSDAGAALKLTGVSLWRLWDQGFEFLFTRDVYNGWLPFVVCTRLQSG